MSPLQCAVIGCGSWAGQAHLPALRSIENVEIVAVCDQDIDRAKTAARTFDVPAAYDSVEALFSAQQPAFVTIATPDDAHAVPIKAAANAGVHIVCEKPLATGAGEAASLVDIAEGSGVMTRMGFILRFAPAVQELQQLLERGAIGDPHLMMIFQQNGQFIDSATPAHWKMDVSRTGGGAIVEYGIHALDLMLGLMGDVMRVAGSGQIQIPERRNELGQTVQIDADDSAVWIAECASGARVVGHAGWATPGRPPGLEVRIFGSGGAIKVELSDEYPGDQALFIAGPDGRFRLHEVGATSGVDRPWWEAWTERLLREFVHHLLENTVPPSPTFADGLRAQQVLEAITTSMREGSWIDL